MALSIAQTLEQFQLILSTTWSHVQFIHRPVYNIVTGAVQTQLNMARQGPVTQELGSGDSH